MSDVDMLESLALRLVQGMEELGVSWWCFNGWSFRRLKQEDLVLKEVTLGSGSENHEQEPEPGTGAASPVEAGDDGRDAERRSNVVSSKALRRRAAEAKAKARAPKSRRPRLPRGPRQRLRKRGWR